MSSSRRRLALGGAILLSLLGAAVLGFWQFWPDHKLQRDASHLRGLSESAVLAKMGAPWKVITAAEIATEPNTPWWNPKGGWEPVPTHPVTNKVLLYFDLWTGAFVYISPTGIVEYVHFVST